MLSILGFTLQIMITKAQQSLPPPGISFKPFNSMENSFISTFLPLKVDYNLFAAKDQISHFLVSPIVL